MQAYNGQILDPPWEFDRSEPIVYNNDTPSNALRSVIYASYKLDYEGSNSLTDDEVIKKRNKLYTLPTNTIRQIQGLVAPGVLELTHVTVLLVGHLEWDGDEYVSFLVRGSHSESPRKNLYGFKHVSFRKDTANNAYWETDDLSSSGITSFIRIAGPAYTPDKGPKEYGTYQEMYDYYKNSDLPLHFYTFGE